MNTLEVANRLVELCRVGETDKAIQELYGANIVSIEPDGAPNKEVRGLEAVIKKGKQFGEMVEEFYGMDVSDPSVAENFFSCSMKMDVKFKGAPRSVIEEICVYNVENGKIVKEEFFYTVNNQ